MISRDPSQIEQERYNTLLSMFPKGGIALDIGAKDCHFSIPLSNIFKRVIALDIELTANPSLKNLHLVKGDVTCLCFPDNSFDFVLCGEVLEHIRPIKLKAAADEIIRVARKWVLIGVPYKQDLRCGQATCYMCGKISPTWGHFNYFDERKLKALFPDLKVERIGYIGETKERTNALSYLLYRIAGNPYGQYFLHCKHCGVKLKKLENNLFQRLCAALALRLEWIQRSFARPQASWIYVLFRYCPVKNFGN